MGNKDNKKDFSKIFDELEETMQSFNAMFSNGECSKKDCKEECTCGQEQENNKWLYTLQTAETSVDAVHKGLIHWNR